MRPCVARHRPRRILTRVVLPARLGPKSAKTSPACTAKLTPRSACTVRAERNGARYVLLTSTKSATAVDMMKRLLRTNYPSPQREQGFPCLRCGLVAKTPQGEQGCPCLRCGLIAY